ncbi:hypothetical protein K1719_037824 [Acacia pycnantha]|nr:hypothetical protein K1719_037824 [Acacia pycnantha]
MAKVDRANDETFKANLTIDGELKLKEMVRKKLKEMIGDSVEDIVVKYVVMLLKNGKCKEEARNHLNHILGDQSGSFVRWLWEHFSENVDSYLQDDGSPKRTNENKHLNSESERRTLHSRSRRNQGWNELAKSTGPPPLLRSEVFGNLEEEGTTRVGQRSSSLLKRKRDAVEISQETIFNPPKRLLQSTIRDAPRLVSQETIFNPPKRHFPSAIGDASRLVSQETIFNPPKRLLQSTIRDAPRLVSQETIFNPPKRLYRSAIRDASRSVSQEPIFNRDASRPVSQETIFNPPKRLFQSAIRDVLR